jgi:malonyl-CoA O-methyltransferase
MPLPEKRLTLSRNVVDFAWLRQVFSDPSHLMDSLFLRREIAARMHERLSMIRIAPRTILDAGCGEGADLPLFQRRFPDADTVMADASPAMLSEAGKRGGASAVCCNFAALPFEKAAFDLLWSNLALHWHPDPGLVFSEWYRVLDKRGGMLMFSCFGPETFAPLRAAFRAVDDKEVFFPFTEMHDLGDRLLAAGFPSPVLDREVILVTYESAERLLSDAGAFGGNALFSDRSGLPGGDAYARLLENLESQKEDGRITLPFEIIYGHAFCFSPERDMSEGMPLRFFPRRQ